MSTDPKPDKGYNKVISSVKGFFSIFSEETKDNLKIAFKGANTFALNLDKPNVPVFEFPLHVKPNINIKSLKRIYVLVKDYFKFHPEIKLKISSLPVENQTKLHIVSDNNLKIKTNFIKHKLNIFKSRIKSYSQLTLNSKIINFNNFNINASYGSAKDFILNTDIVSIDNFFLKQPDIKNINIEKSKPPHIIEEITTLKPYIRKRSQAFPTTLPIERKPIKLALFSYREIDFFKSKLAEKFKINKRIIKLISIYNKLDVKNIQNFKFDNNSKNLYFNFKPNTNNSIDDDFSILIIALRLDNQSTLSLMINESEFRKHAG